MHQIYLITNLINGKVYVGQTAKGLDERWATHVRAWRKGKSPHLYAAFRKYGLASFSITLLSVCDTKEQANYQEKLWILLYNSHNPDIGYNMTDGGDGGGVFTGRKHRPESIEKMRKSATGRSPSKETKEKISKTRKGMVGEKSPAFNRSISSKEIVRLYQEGKTTRQIAKIFGVEKTLVTGRLESSGIALRLNPRDARKARLISEGKERFLKIDDKELARLYNNGYTTEEIAPMFELTRIAVRNRLIKEGVTFRHGGKRLKEEWPKHQI